MTYRTRRALVLALCVSAATTLTTVTGPAAAAATPSPPSPGALCAQPRGPAGQERVGLPVPLDYRDPGAQRRHRS